MFTEENQQLNNTNAFTFQYTESQDGQITLLQLACIVEHLKPILSNFCSPGNTFYSIMNLKAEVGWCWGGNPLYTVFFGLCHALVTCIGIVNSEITCDSEWDTHAFTRVFHNGPSSHFCQ